MPAGHRLAGSCVASVVTGEAGATNAPQIDFHMLDCPVFGIARFRGVGCWLRFGLGGVVREQSGLRPLCLFQ
jgi:hypothetical protein